MSAGVDPEVPRRTWALVAEAAVMHRRLMAGEEVSYSDPDLQRTRESMARGSLLRAVEQALGAGVEREGIVDAICSGDRSVDVDGAHETRPGASSVPRAAIASSRHLHDDHRA